MRTRLLATWFITGKTKWTLKSCLCQTGEWIIDHLPLPKAVRKNVGEALNSEVLDDAVSKGGATKLQVRDSWHP